MPQLMHHGVKERLLAVRPVQVAVGQAMALSDERQCLPRIQVLEAGVEMGARVAVAGRVVEADFDAAEYPGELVEPVQVDLGEVVDMHPGELLDCSHGGRPTGLVPKESKLILTNGRVLGPELLLLVVHAHAVGLVDLARLLRADRAREVDPVVTGNREADGLLSAGEYVYEDESICVVTASAVLGLRLCRRAAPGGCRWAGCCRSSPSALQAHEQDVLGAYRGTADDRVGGADARYPFDDKI